MSEEAGKEQFTLFDEYLATGEKITFSTEKIFEPAEGLALGISNERLLFLDKKDFFHDIKYGHIVSLGLKNTYKYVNEYLFTLFLGLICLFFGLIAYQGFLKTIGLILLGVAVFFFVAFLSSRKTVFFIATEDGKEQQIDLKGLDSRRVARDLEIGIRNAEKRYLENRI